MDIEIVARGNIKGTPPVNGRVPLFLQAYALVEKYCYSPYFLYNLFLIVAFFAASKMSAIRPSFSNS